MIMMMIDCRICNSHAAADVDLHGLQKETSHMSSEILSNHIQMPCTFIVQNTSSLLKLFVLSTYWCSQWWHLAIHSLKHLWTCVSDFISTNHTSLWVHGNWADDLHTFAQMDEVCCKVRVAITYQVFSENLRVPVTGAIYKYVFVFCKAFIHR